MRRAGRWRLENCHRQQSRWQRTFSVVLQNWHHHFLEDGITFAVHTSRSKILLPFQSTCLLVWSIKCCPCTLKIHLHIYYYDCQFCLMGFSLTVIPHRAGFPKRAFGIMGTGFLWAIPVSQPNSLKTFMRTWNTDPCWPVKITHLGVSWWWNKHVILNNVCNKLVSSFLVTKDEKQSCKNGVHKGVNEELKHQLDLDKI